jgi:hypothetical protein
MKHKELIKPILDYKQNKIMSNSLSRYLNRINKKLFPKEALSYNHEEGEALVDQNRNRDVMTKETLQFQKRRRKYSGFYSKLINYFLKKVQPVGNEVIFITDETVLRL